MQWISEPQTELAAAVRKSFAKLKWNELGPLLVYSVEREDEGDNVVLDRLKFVGKGGLMLTKFSLKGTWAATRVAGKVVIPVTRVGLKATSLVSDVATAGLAQLEKHINEADVTQLRALFSWLDEEFGVVAKSMEIEFSDLEIKKMGEEMQLAANASVDDVAVFGRWFASESVHAAKLREIVKDTKSKAGKADDTKLSKKEKKAAAKALKERQAADKKAMLEDGATSDGGTSGGETGGAASGGEGVVALSLPALKTRLFDQLGLIADIFESKMSASHFEKIMQEMDDTGDGDVSLEQFLAWMGSKSSIVKGIRKESVRRDKIAAEELDEVAAAKAADEAAARTAAILGIFELLEPDERRRVPVENFEGLEERTGISMNERELARALRLLDPTKLGIIKEPAYLAWMEMPTNRTARALIVKQLGGDEPEAEDGADEQAGKGKSKKLSKKERQKSMDAEAELALQSEDQLQEGADFAVSDTCRDLWDKLDVEGDGEYIDMKAMEGIGQVTGAKLSKAEKAALKADHVLDPEQFGDVHILNFEKWLKLSEHPVVMKIMKKYAKTSKKLDRAKSKDQTQTPEEIRSEAIRNLFSVIAGNENEMATDNLSEKILSVTREGITEEELAEIDDSLKKAAAVSKAALARAAHAMDPDETGIISFETWQAWHDREEDEENPISLQMLGHKEEVEMVQEEEEKMGMSDEELKSLFEILDTGGDGTLSRPDWSNIEMVLSIKLEKDTMDMAMTEMSTFANKLATGTGTWDTDVLTEEQEETREEILVGEVAAVDALAEADAWVKLKTNELTAETLLGKLVKVMVK